MKSYVNYSDKIKFDASRSIIVKYNKNEKVFIMTYRTIFLNIFMVIFCSVYSPIIIGGQNKMGMSQMQDFERELEEANKAIEEYVASLPPAEQAEFNRQVEEMSRMFENMSEDEFENFLGEMFADEPMEPNPFQETEQIVQEVIDVTISAEDKKKADSAIKVIDDIIKQSNLFMVIINSSPELPNRITRWGTKNNIPNWPAGGTWNTFRLELEALIQKLYKVEDQDVVTKKYKYLLDLTADEGLFNNLIQLQTQLNSLVPTINLPEFGIQKLSSESKTVIQDILKTYTESFYLLGIPKALDALFEKYAPEAEKIRTAEEAANKKALDEATKLVRTPAYQTEAGMEAGMDYDYGYGYSPYGGGYDDYGYPSYGGYNDYGYSPDYGSYGGDSGTGARGAGGSSGGGSSGGGSSGGETTGKTEKGKEASTQPQKSTFVPQHEIERAIADIKHGLDDIKAAMTDEEGKPTKLAQLADTINKSDVDVILAGSTLPKIVDKKLETISQSLKTIDEKKLNQNELAHYQRQVQLAFDKDKKELETIRDAINSFGTKEEIEKEEATAKKSGQKESDQSKKTDIKTLSGEKRWAYFGGDKKDLGTDDKSKKLEEDIGSPVSLFKIRDNINTLFDDMKKFMAKKSDIPVAVKKETPIKETPVVEEE